MSYCLTNSFFFFFNDTATTEIYTLSLHDALPILSGISPRQRRPEPVRNRLEMNEEKCASLLRTARSASALSSRSGDRKSTRLNSSHDQISYAVFCLKKKKNEN